MIRPRRTNGNPALSRAALTGNTLQHRAPFPPADTGTPLVFDSGRCHQSASVPVRHYFRQLRDIQRIARAAPNVPNPNWSNSGCPAPPRQTS